MGKNYGEDFIKNLRAAFNLKKTDEELEEEKARELKVKLEDAKKEMLMQQLQQASSIIKQKKGASTSQQVWSQSQLNAQQQAGSMVIGGNIISGTQSVSIRGGNATITTTNPNTYSYVSSAVFGGAGGSGASGSGGGAGTWTSSVQLYPQAPVEREHNEQGVCQKSYDQGYQDGLKAPRPKKTKAK